MDIILGIILGGIVVTSIMLMVWRNTKKKRVNSQSVILLDRIKKVCKFITVEGDFAEIYHYKDVQKRFLKLVSSEKKALVVIQAKAHVGYDLSKIELQSDTAAKKIILKNFPLPEVLSIETNLDYYDKSDGLFNKFKANDLTTLQNDAKTHIQDKIPESGLIQIAQKEALETILLIETIVETIGWKLDYSALEIQEKVVKQLKD